MRAHLRRKLSPINAIKIALISIVSGSAASAVFVDITNSSGIVDFERIDRLGVPDFVERGGSIIVMDFNQDGWQDLYVTRYGQDDILFQNNQGTFQRIDNPLGLNTSNGGNSSAWADFDNDGDKDMIVAVLDEKKHLMYLNNGDGTYTQVGEERGIALPSINDHRGSSVAFGDVNRDGFLDVVIGEWWTGNTIENPEQHYGLFINEGARNPGYFINATESAGYVFSSSSIHFYSPCITDLDSDGWPDLATVVDFGGSAIFWNNADGTFTNTTEVSQVGVERHGMGSAIGDINRDGKLDWFVTTIAMAFSPLDGEANQLYLNQGARLFQNSSVEAGVSQGGWGWGTNFFDHDNDSDLDIVMVNAENTLQVGEDRINQTGPMILWQNEGDLTFTDISDSSNVDRVGRGAGIVNFDFDNDGDLDLFAVHEDSPPVLLENKQSGDPLSWIRLSFEGTISNRDGIGVQVTLEAIENGPIQFAEYNPSNAYLSQLEPFLHFGLGDTNDSIHKITVRWPSSIVQELSNVDPRQVLHIVEDESLLQGSTIPVFSQEPQQQVISTGETLNLEVEIEGNFQPTIRWYRNGELLAGKEGKTLTFQSVVPTDAGTYYAIATNESGSKKSAEATIGVRSLFPDKSVARQWNEAILDAIRINFPDPPIVARNLYHASAAMWDAFWPFQENGWGNAQPIFYQEIVSPESWTGAREASQAEAISHAVYRIVSERYKNAFNSEAILLSFKDLMESLGYDPNEEGIVGDSPSAVGNRIGFAILAAGISDGSNEENGYVDGSDYSPVNEPLIYGTSGVTLVDPNRWQPLSLEQSVTKNGIDLGEETQSFLTPSWNLVTPFALEKPTPSTISIDPGPQPLFGTETEPQYISENIEVIELSSLLDPNDGTTIDASPGAMQNNPFGTQGGTGRKINPFTGLPYIPNIVNRGDYWRVTAEFWSDGPGVEGPPGVWNMLHNQVSDDPSFSRRFAGTGPVLSSLEWDVHAYVAINGALHDAAIAAWTIKSKYDSIRPMSMIRYLASLGQSSKPELPSFHSSGLPLKPNLIELITVESSAPGEKHAHLSEYIGEIALFTWKGVPDNPDTESSGAGWIRGADWTPYHLRTFPTPNFAGYVSGHSTFARAGAEVMALLTGSPYFPRGLKEFHFKAGESLQVEYGPSQDLTIQCATYYDAADLTGIARLYCGVHIAADDFVGRRIGARVGVDAFLKARTLRNNNPHIYSVDTPSIKYSLPARSSSPLMSFGFRGESLSPLPTIIASSRKEAIASSKAGIYAYPASTIESGVEVLSKGRPVSQINVRGELNPQKSISIRFKIDTEDPVFLIVVGNTKDTSNPPAEMRLTAYQTDSETATEIASNQNWLAGESASVATTFTERDSTMESLNEKAVSIPLALSKGEYRVELGITEGETKGILTISTVK